MIPPWLERQRPYLWRLGVEHSEGLMSRYVERYRPSKRPFVKDVYRELIGEIQAVRLLEAPLPMDRFAHTDVRDGRIEITINALIGRMEKVRDPERVKHVAAWHESMHAALHVKRRRPAPAPSLPLGLEVETSSPILCRGAGERRGTVDPGEFVAETAGLAAAIADADLRRCVSYLNFLQLAAMGGAMGVPGWQLLGATSAGIGVNCTALRRYLQQHGICRLSVRGEKARLIGTPTTFRGFVCLEPNSASMSSVA